MPESVHSSLYCLTTPQGLITYRLKHSQRKTIMIRIEENLQVHVCAPWHARVSDIERFLFQKAQWVFRKIEELKKRPRFVPNRAYADDQSYLFLGKHCRLKIEDGPSEGTSLSFDGSVWKVVVPAVLSEAQKNEQIRERFLIWYHLQAKDILPQRVEHYSRLMEVSPRRIAVKAQKSMWGSCDFRKQMIHLNWQLVMTPVDVLDYVVVHELAHLTFPNHSQRFWSKVEKFFPRYKECRQWLKAHQREITSLP